MMLYLDYVWMPPELTKDSLMADLAFYNGRHELFLLSYLHAN